jgi:tricarballylate dehydrogenase
VVLEQPENFAWQIFDKKVENLIRDEYRIKRVTKVIVGSIEELAHKLEGVNAERFLSYIKEYNAAVQQDIPFNATIKDGRCTKGLKVNKTNWANTIDTAPFHGYQVTCGLTFTFGGLRITEDAQVLDVDMVPIKGLYAAGEIVGGIFYFNYPGGSGLINGAVFGRIAGSSAAGEAGKALAAE